MATGVYRTLMSGRFDPMMLHVQHKVLPLSKLGRFPIPGMWNSEYVPPLSLYTRNIRNAVTGFIIRFNIHMLV